MSAESYCAPRADMSPEVIQWRQARALRAAMRDLRRGRRVPPAQRPLPRPGRREAAR